MQQLKDLTCSIGSVQRLPGLAADSLCTRWFCRTYEQSVVSRCYKAKVPNQQSHGTLCQGETQPSSCAADDITSQQQQLEGDAINSYALNYTSSAMPEADDPSEDQPHLPITCISYLGSDNSKFRLWLGGPAAGQVVDCTWDQVAPLGRTVAMSNTAVTAMCRSWSGGYTILGSMDGVICVQRTLATGESDSGRCVLQRLLTTPWKKQQQLVAGQICQQHLLWGDLAICHLQQ